MSTRPTVATRYDAIVIGGGPGGSAAAGFLAQKGARVALFEKGLFPRYHIGESLLPATTLGFLRKLGAEELVARQGFTRKLGGTFIWGRSREPWTFSFRRTGEEDYRVARDQPFLHSYQVERSIYDKVLLDHVRTLGVEVHECSSFLDLHGLDDDEKTVVIQVDGTEIALKARYVLDASGRNSRIRTRFGERHYDPFFRNVAVYRYFTGGRRLDGDRAGNILTVAFRHGWIWYIPLGDGLTSVGLVLARDKYNEIKHLGLETIFDRMVPRAPEIGELLSGARRCETAPYDRIRIDIDYSYVHSEFVCHGIFLVGDAACFIDPLFSSGVHLATYAGYLAAEAIGKIRAGTASYGEAVAEYEGLYRREYSAFYRLLVSFYEVHADPESYFWTARKVLSREFASAEDAFIALVSGHGTTGHGLFSSKEEFIANIAWGRESLTTLIDVVSPGQPLPSGGIERLKRAHDFMIAIDESRHRVLRETLGKPGEG